MVDVKPTNVKLKDRAERIVSEIAQCNQEKAKNILEKNGYNVKEAILQIKYNCSFEEAQKLLTEHSGVLRKAFETFDK
jgi:N-acetylmuramic acid 6-phosphate etherase